MNKPTIKDLIKKAVANEENIHDEQVNWNWVSADVYMDNAELKLGYDEDTLHEVINGLENGRTDSYERIIYALENGLFTKQILLDGIKEHYKL